MSFDRILVAIDFSPASLAALAAALDVARADARVTLVHVVPVSLADPVAYPWATDWLYEHRTGQAEDRLSALAAHARSADGPTVETLVVRGRPAVELARLAGDADLVVCGTHGRGALARLALGSVALELTRTAPCPVLVARAADAVRGPGALARFERGLT